MASADEKAYRELVARRAELQAKKRLSNPEKNELEKIEASLGDSTDFKSFLKRLTQIRQGEAEIAAGNVASLDDLAESLRRRGIKE